MAGARHRTWRGGARGRMFIGEELIGLVWHPHLFGEGWVNLTGGENEPPDITVGPDSIFTLARRGHHCAVRVRYTRRTGIFPTVDTEEEATIAAAAGSVTLTTDPDTVLVNFRIRGL